MNLKVGRTAANRLATVRCGIAQPDEVSHYLPSPRRS